MGTILQRERCRLYVVAPEAHFGDITPMPEIPQLPWAARPQFLPDDLLGRIGGRRAGSSALPWGEIEARRRQLDQMLEGVIPDADARRRAIAGGGFPP